MMDVARRALADIEGDWAAALGTGDIAQMRTTLAAIRMLQHSRRET